eukprot:NODE_501_length_883_cov_240.088158_g493_i0.p1 GENE.NODE_501_length_883_cov_240.088158_g493_i0~~NODE_501_length_883_cov_240.088158_g493_i0.p1  ORF type:complete len:254 (+),score=58.96 NODE_501_length_883_cov_240.088158_g493_i0:32-763(+)
MDTLDSELKTNKAVLRAEKESRQKDKEQLEERIRTLTADRDDQVGRLRSDISDLEQKCSIHRAASERHRKEKEEREEELLQKRLALDATTERAASLEQRLGETTEKWDQEKRTVVAQTEGYLSMQKALYQRESENSELKQQLKQSNEDLRKAMQRQLDQTTEMNKERTELREKAAALANTAEECETLRAEATQLRQENALSRQRKQEWQSVLQDLYAKNAALESDLEKLREAHPPPSQRRAPI